MADTHYVLQQADTKQYVARVVRFPYTVVLTSDVNEAKHFSSHGRANRFRRSHGDEQTTVTPSPIFEV